MSYDKGILVLRVNVSGEEAYKYVKSKETKPVSTPQEVADLVAEEQDADVIFYNAPIQRDIAKLLVDACIKRRRRKNVILILVTLGGDPDASYRISRFLQDKYDRFILYVSGICKSAGTLVALGAHELIVSDHGELGPLDVQMRKKDEIWESQSGLTVMDALTALKHNAFKAFHEFFRDLADRGDVSISLRTASQIATDMATGMFAPIYRQVNPLDIGEAGRAMNIAGQYGKRLLRKGGNIEQASLEAVS